MDAFKEKFKILLRDKKTEAQFVNALFEYVRRGSAKEINHLLDIIHEGHHEHLLLRHMPEEETILHAAVKARATKDVISRLVDICPDLLFSSRETSDTHRGQTALHIAITQSNLEIVETLLLKTKIMGVEKKRSLLHQRATGSRFVNSVMMGEFPLTVAALTLNTVMMDVLLKHGAEIYKQNGLGDNVCHSLVKYAHLYPEKVSEIVKICEHISKLTVTGVADKTGIKDIESISHTDLEKQNIHIWLAENIERLNPLKLSAKLGQQVIFKYIIELKGVYCYINSEDGLFDVKLYDVTDIDTISELKFSDVIPIDFDVLKTVPEANLKRKRSKTVPTLEMIFSSDASTVFKFIQFSPLHYVINRKWDFYRWFYLIWGILHVIFMVGYSVYAVERTKLARTMFNNSVSVNYLNQIGGNTFVTFYVVLSLVVSSIYLIQEIVRVFKHRMPWSWSHVMNCYHNGPFRMVLVLFSVCVIADFIWRMTDINYENYLLVCAMILGWWFLVFFLRGLRQFSFFTVMIQKVLIGDMFRFSIVIGMELVAFTTAMFIAFQGSVTTDDTVENYGKLMVHMFKMMFGFTSLDVLFEARQAWFAVCLYTAFVLLTYVLMINSLIAMMSNTCSVVSQNRDVQWRVQQLSIVLFFESIFPSCCLRYVGQPRKCVWYDADKQKFKSKQRYFMEVRSLLEITRSKSRLRLTPETMIESIFNTIREIQLPTFGVFETEIKEPKKRYDEIIETRREEVGSTMVPKEKDKLAKPDRAGEEVNKEMGVNNPKEKKKRKKKKKIAVEPESPSGDLISSHMTEVDYLSSNLITPEPDIAITRNVVTASRKSSTLEIHSM